jgi:hypothetical protein
MPASSPTDCPMCGKVASLAWCWRARQYLCDGCYACIVGPDSRGRAEARRRYPALARRLAWKR